MGMLIGPRCFDWGARTYVMGILNVTPDSFAGDGVGGDTEVAVGQALAFAGDGADIIDIGGQSSRPGAVPVEAGAEMDRVLPVLASLSHRQQVALSIDTDKPEVADAALRAGAHLVNDINGLRADPAMARVIARHGAAVVVMANLRGAVYTDVVEAVKAQLLESLERAHAAGISRDRIIVDPGFGFGPRPEENLDLVRRLGELRMLGCPILLGPSRKGTIGRVLGLPVEERTEGTAAVVSAAIERGVDLVRVHDVRAIVRTARMTDALVRGWQPPREKD